MKATQFALYKLLLLTILLSGASSCAPVLGKTIDVPEIPTIKTDSARLEYRGRQLAVAGFKDNRPVQPGDAEDVTEPAGPVTKTVEDALIRSLQDLGFVISDNAPVLLTGEIRKWQTKVTAATSGVIQSEAALYIELIDPANHRIYTGNFTGSTSTRAPVISEVDAQDSLSKAMGQAILQMLGDRELLKKISSF